jgi:hypothetical protein
MINNQLYNQKDAKINFFLKNCWLLPPGPLKLKIKVIFEISDPKNIAVQSSISK